MTNHFWVVGTDTEVGKTVVTTYLLRYFQEKGETLAYKPVQTGLVQEESRSYYADTEFYQTHSRVPLVKEHLNTYSFKEPASPHYAARLENAVIDERVILQQIDKLKAIYQYIICEGAGGLYVPLNEDFHFLKLIEQSRLPVILVARSSLGTINHTLLSIEALTNRNIQIRGIIFNRFTNTKLEIENIRTINKMTSIPSMIIPQLKNLADLKELEMNNIDELFERVGSL
ncbi:dethiobiotin synthase [Metabacillus endolithicus]|uniref:ATP-dependent dethiobiotin synthetase BioD n=2 Tax=Metabacillus endolithicus TaxID=1535204 RepID=A0ABW5BTT8_9BACI